MSTEDTMFFANEVKRFDKYCHPAKGFAVVRVGHVRLSGDQPVQVERAGDVQIVWFLQGEYRGETEDGYTYSVKEGEVGVIFSANRRLVIHAAQTPTEYRYLAIDGGSATLECIAAGLWDGIAGKATPSAELLERIAQHLPGDLPTDEFCADVAARELLFDTAVQVREQARSRIAHDAMHRMNWRYTDTEFSIDILQKEMKISRSSLGAHFKNNTGKSPLTYLTGIRVKHAKHLLSKTRKKVAVVARESGYGNAVYFTQVITRHTGMSPRAYRYQFIPKGTPKKEKKAKNG